MLDTLERAGTITTRERYEADKLHKWIIEGLDYGVYSWSGAEYPIRWTIAERVEILTICTVAWCGTEDEADWMVDRDETAKLAA